MLRDTHSWGDIAYRWRMDRVAIGGGTLEVAVQGAGQPVVLIQTALTADELFPLADHLALVDGLQPIAYHRRGYAGSSPTKGPGSIRRDAEDCLELLEALAIESAHLVGVSYSAAVALEVATLDSRRVRTVSVIEPPPVHIPDAAEFIAANESMVNLYETHGPRFALDSFLTELMGSDWRTELELVLPGAVQQVERDAVTFFGSDIPAILGWEFSIEKARSITQPNLYIGGELSGRWFAQVRDLMVDWLGHSPHVVIAGADHNLALTHPGEVARYLVDFFRRFE